MFSSNYNGNIFWVRQFYGGKTFDIRTNLISEGTNYEFDNIDGVDVSSSGNEYLYSIVADGSYVVISSVGSKTFIFNKDGSFISSIDRAGNRVALHSNYLYISDGNSSNYIYDISDPQNQSI